MFDASRNVGTIIDTADNEDGMEQIIAVRRAWTTVL